MADASSSESLNQTRPLLEMVNVSKSFPGVRALANVNLELYAGEVLALLGENGAGKSTLIKILGGVHMPDSGDIKIKGRGLPIDSPSASQRAGVGIIFQEFNLIPALTARENIFLGQEESPFSWIAKGQEDEQARVLFDRIGVQVDPNALCRNLTVAQQQVVEIAKALALNAQIVVMDEPSAALTPREVEGLYEIVDELRRQGIGIIYISHRLDEIERLADRIMVLRDGQYVGTRDADGVTRDEIIEMMVGRSLDNEFPEQTRPLGEIRLEVQGLSRGSVVKDVSFNVRAGEILGVAGLVGAGRTETVRLLFGADKPDAGSIMLDGKRLKIQSPRQSIAKGICLLTEDRKGQGLVLGQTVQENFGLPNMEQFANGGFVNKGQETLAFDRYIEQLQIKITGNGQIAETLSGGNQQKVALGKWLSIKPDVLLVNEPTRGVDVGAKSEIYQRMRELAARGITIIFASTDIQEITYLPDRVITFYRGMMIDEHRLEKIKTPVILKEITDPFNETNL